MDHDLAISLNGQWVEKKGRRGLKFSILSPSSLFVLLKKLKIN
jgi:hypothetical protein